MSKPKVIIVIPAFNVANVLGKTIASIPRGSYDEIIVVDDGSRDGTCEVAHKMGATVIIHPKNKGYGGAQKTGYKLAIGKNADMVVMVHGDNQYDPSFVPAFVRKIADEGYYLVTGTRMVLGDVLEKGMPYGNLSPIGS